MMNLKELSDIVRRQDPCDMGAEVDKYYALLSQKAAGQVKGNFNADLNNAGQFLDRIQDKITNINLGRCLALRELLDRMSGNSQAEQYKQRAESIIKKTDVIDQERAYFDLGVVAYRKGHTDAAFSIFKKAEILAIKAKLEPNPAVLYNIGKILQEKKADPNSIEPEYLTALNISRDYKTLNNHAALFIEDEDYEGAIELLEEAIKSSPNAIPVLANLAISFRKTEGDPLEKVKHLRALYYKDPSKKAVVAGLLAREHFQLSNYIRAVEVAKEFLEHMEQEE